jgi:hypothetical protein
MSIIDPKYKGRPAKADWLTEFLNKNATTAIFRTVKSKSEDGTETSEQVDTGKTLTDIEKLFDVAAANGIDARGKYGAQVGRLNATGRLRMTIGNSLRAAAKKRGGLYNLAKEFVDADEAFMDGAVPTHRPDGTKIAAAPVVGSKLPTTGAETPVNEPA